MEPMVDIIKSGIKSISKTKKPKIKGIDFVKSLKKAIEANDPLHSPNYDKIRIQVVKELKINKVLFDEILGYLIKTDKLEGILIYPSYGSVKIYHPNMKLTNIYAQYGFDSITTTGEGLKYADELV